MNSLLIAVNIFQSKQWDKCKSWTQGLKPRFMFCCVQFESDSVDSSSMVRLDYLNKSAKDIVPGSTSHKPLIYEMFDGLANMGADYFMFMNCDILLSEEAVTWMTEQTEYESACFSRVDAGPESRKNFATCKPYGFDGFYVKSSWWKEHRSDFLDISNIYAEPYWDNAYAVQLHLKSRCYFHNKIPLMYHVGHPRRWCRTSPEGQWNHDRFVTSGLAKVWKEYLSRTVHSRSYINSKMTREMIEKEDEVEKNLYSL